jgi:hypothetical protein
MDDNIAEVVQELSGLLRRISEKRDQQLKPQGNETSAETLKDIELLARTREATREGEHVGEGVIQTLENQNHILDSVIARLREKPRKG